MCDKSLLEMILVIRIGWLEDSGMIVRRDGVSCEVSDVAGLCWMLPRWSEGLEMMRSEGEAGREDC